MAEPERNQQSKGLSDALREAVERTFASTAGSADDTRERAGELRAASHGPAGARRRQGDATGKPRGGGGASRRDPAPAQAAGRAGAAGALAHPARPSKGPG